MKQYNSWGLFPKYAPSKVVQLFWRNEIPEMLSWNASLLPYGLGKSYGDVCLNDNGILIDCIRLNHFIYFDRQQGILCCESGVTLKSILELVVPCGWFLPVVPGTQLITVGGAIANDVHGKNHHRSGTFGRYVLRFELLRSNGERIICSPTVNAELYRATIGGLGLTGVILWAEIQLIPIKSPFLNVEFIKFASLDDFFSINEESEHFFDYTVAWLDFSNGGINRVRGIFQRANFAERETDLKTSGSKSIKIPFPFPLSLINNASVFLFNFLYYNKQSEERRSAFIHFEKFFFPLDKIYNWNYIYGKNGFLQYQFVIPFKNGRATLVNFINTCKKLNLYSFLTVLKTFGKMTSPGLLSFPMEGITMAVDFPFEPNIFKKLETLDEIIQESGGRLYPAKDARMGANFFLSSYPNLEKFILCKDEKFSSSFWRRVTKEL
jgi:FAD/FMN-containing dehydrogenase